jgi:hypothetical protein
MVSLHDDKIALTPATVNNKSAGAGTKKPPELSPAAYGSGRGLVYALIE